MVLTHLWAGYFECLTGLAVNLGLSSTSMATIIHEAFFQGPKPPQVGERDLVHSTTTVSKTRGGARGRSSWEDVLRAFQALYFSLGCWAFCSRPRQPSALCRWGPRAAPRSALRHEAAFRLREVRTCIVRLRRAPSNGRGQSHLLQRWASSASSP